MVQNVPGSLLFSTARTSQREKLFKWVGPITDLTIGLVSLKTKNIKLQSIKDADKYRIGTIRDGSPEQLVLEAGIQESKVDPIVKTKFLKNKVVSPKGSVVFLIFPSLSVGAPSETLLRHCQVLVQQ